MTFTNYRYEIWRFFMFFESSCFGGDSFGALVTAAD